jgi:tetratricopeptide (TPR) repeat protein
MISLRRQPIEPQRPQSTQKPYWFSLRSLRPPRFIGSLRCYLAQTVLFYVAAVVPAGATTTDFSLAARIETLERVVSQEPENLRAAAEYRQLVIAAGKFDRSIDFLEKLARRKDSGPNVQISLALAYVDKVPPSGDIRRLYLGRDAITAATRSIERRPTVLAYYIRGLVNLYYNNLIFKRIPRGIADLNAALALVTAETPRILVARIYRALGDGHWRLEDRAKAREVWSAGLAKIPEDGGLKERVSSSDAHAADVVSAALYAGTRVDTSLQELATGR